MLEKLEEIEQRFESIESQLQDPKNTTNPNELQRLGKARAEELFAKVAASVTHTETHDVRLRPELASPRAP